MAAIAEHPVYRANVKLSWGGVIAGLVVAMGVWLLLTVLGLAIGLSAIDPYDRSSIGTAGTTTGIWSAIVPLVALFVGALVAARTAGILDRATGALHGVVLWALSTLVTVVLLGSMVRGIASIATGAVGRGVATTLVPDRPASARPERAGRGGGEDLETSALRAADATGHAMWWLFGGMAVSLAASIVGATIGVSRKQRLASTASLVDVTEAHA